MEKEMSTVPMEVDGMPESSSGVHNIQATTLEQVRDLMQLSSVGENDGTMLFRQDTIVEDTLPVNGNDTEINKTDDNGMGEMKVESNSSNLPQIMTEPEMNPSSSFSAIQNREIPPAQSTSSDLQVKEEPQFKE